MRKVMINMELLNFKKLTSYQTVAHINRTKWDKWAEPNF